MQWLKGGETRGHVWVKPRHTPMWETWTGLNSSIHCPLVLTKAGGKGSCMAGVYGRTLP